MDEVNPKTGRKAEVTDGSLFLAEPTHEFYLLWTVFLKTVLSNCM